MKSVVACGFKSFQFEGVLKLICLCLAGVSIEHLNWSDFIVRYDHLKTLFYFSPLYCGSEGYSRKAFYKRENYQPMSKLLA
ncbi:hypothetical protein [Bartonella sp. MF74HXZ]|uniref:hypothetical protein n=1 Tax=Bartonella sp. MF74HXZ TaxID=1461006 RepID=UPI0035D10AA6